MGSNSINTNVGAMVALSSLRVTQAALNVSSKQVPVRLPRRRRGR